MKDFKHVIVLLIISIRRFKRCKQDHATILIGKTTKEMTALSYT